MIKKNTLFVFLCAMFLVSFSSTVRADVYPFFIHITQPGSELPFDGNFQDGTAAEIRFMLQDAVQSSDVTIKIKNGATTVRTIELPGIMGDYHIVEFDGRGDDNAPVPLGVYSIEITAAQDTGHTTYTEIYNAGADAAGLSTRGVTVLNNPSWNNFGFAFGVTTPTAGSPWNFTGLGRVGANGILFGDTLNGAHLTTTGDTLGIRNRRYAPTADADGYIYVIGRDQKEILRFHPDTLVVSVFIDTVSTAGLINDIAVAGSGANKYLWVCSTTGIYGAAIGEAATYTGAVDSLIPAPAGSQYWAVLPGDGDALYVVYNASTQTAGASGVLKYNMPTPAAKVVADTVWKKVFTVGDAVSMDIWRGETSAASDDILYVTLDQESTGDGYGGIYAVTGLETAAPTYIWAYVDPDGNTTRTRGRAVVDYVGNLVYWENSNEEIIIISPPNGPNSATITAPQTFSITSILPVELSTFTAAVKDGKVLLKWSTASELNNRGFEVERKAAGLDFITVGFVDGKGTTSEKQEYSFEDKSLAEGSYSYRLKQVDFDGTFKYTDAVEVDLTTPKSFALEQNYPNPFNPVTNIKFSIPSDMNVTLKIYNTLGEEVLSLLNNEMKTAGNHIITFNASDLSSGTYIYTIQADGQTLTKKMILMK